MEAARAQERRELLRRAAITAVAMLVAVGPIISIAGAGPGVWSFGIAVITALVAAAADTVRTRREWDRIGGSGLRLEIRDAIRSGHLPDDADPDTWTYPIAERLKSVRSAPWSVAGVGVAFVALVALGAQQHRLTPVSIGFVALDLVVVVVLLVLAVRDRTSRRGPVLAAFLDELDARADTVPVAG